MTEGGVHVGCRRALRVTWRRGSKQCRVKGCVVVFGGDRAAGFCSLVEKCGQHVSCEFDRLSGLLLNMVRVGVGVDVTVYLAVTPL